MTHAISADEYERLAEAELRLAAGAVDEDNRSHHLNQAAVYAHLSEQANAAWTNWTSAAA